MTTFSPLLLTISFPPPPPPPLPDAAGAAVVARPAGALVPAEDCDLPFPPNIRSNFFSAALLLSFLAATGSGTGSDAAAGVGIQSSSDSAAGLLRFPSRSSRSSPRLLRSGDRSRFR